MIGLAADEDLDNRIIRGLLRRNPQLSITRVQDVGLSGAADPQVLEWAAREGRVLLTHDAATMRHYASERLREGEPMAGVFAVSRKAPMGEIIEDILLIAEGSEEGEWEGRVEYIPLS